MKLRYHVAYRFINDWRFIDEIMETTFPNWQTAKPVTDKDFERAAQSIALFDLIDPEDAKHYFITGTVMEKMEYLKVSKRDVPGYGMQYDWRVFAGAKAGKKTFIFPNGQMFRFKIDAGGLISIFYAGYDSGVKNVPDTEVKWVMLYFDTKDGRQCEHFMSEDGKLFEEFIYKLLCFFYLSENTEEILKPGHRQGTKKSGKLINDLGAPLIIVNSKWSITSVRTEGFNVSGHLAIRWTGPGSKIPKMVFIEPFEKKGYVRKALSETIK
jgi:hypothetical protein